MDRSDRITLEVALESLTEARIASRAGADRIELCAALDVGGLTPSVGTLRVIRADIDLPIFAMIRPRAGGFCYSPDELAVMRSDIQSLLAAGATGVVFGVLDRDFCVDREACADLIAACEGRPAVFHRAFDLTPDHNLALEALIGLGFKRLLTSGHQSVCVSEAAMSRIAELVTVAGSRIEIMPGSGVRAESVAALVRRVGCTSVHGAFRRRSVEVGLSQEAVEFGFGVAGQGNQVSTTDETMIHATRQALNTISHARPSLVLAFVSDLIFQSKITGVATHLGVSVRCARSIEQARRLLPQATSLFVDLTIEEAGLLAFLAESIRENPNMESIGFFPHVEADVARAARAAGVGKVLTRGQFTEQLPRLLEDSIKRG